MSQQSEQSETDMNLQSKLIFTTVIVFYTHIYLNNSLESATFGAIYLGAVGIPVVTSRSLCIDFIDQSRKRSANTSTDEIEIIDQSRNSRLTDTRPLCKYGAKCYRENPLHFMEYRHSGREISKLYLQQNNKTMMIISYCLAFILLVLA